VLMRKSTREVRVTTVRSPAERREAGRALRDKISRKSHAIWQAPADRPDPILLLADSSKGRMPELLPIRYGRMLPSPFTFLRGAAAVMAADLAGTPTTGLRVQACGDCHILNFGAFATPERNLIFDINDFDETLPAPWEWDLKRLVTSVEVAGRAAGCKAASRAQAVRAAIGSYREHMAEYATMPALEVWYQHINLTALVQRMPDRKGRARTRKEIAKARKKSTPAHLFPSLAERSGETVGIKDEPPLLFHPRAQQSAAYRRRTADTFTRYRESLAAQYRVLFDRFEFRDLAVKVVGIGAVGTFCVVALFQDAEGAPLFLQLKEARASVLEPYAGASEYAMHGERVVVGQRLMQAASDIFLGWTAGLEPNRHFYIRQLRDIKISLPIEATSDPVELEYFAQACGWVLARAHARSGDPAIIAGYLGSSDAFDEAIMMFAAAYADQTERDHTALVNAVKAGRIKAKAA
jgi:uncharacterized protein (DUF2252 family)